MMSTTTDTGCRTKYKFRGSIWLFSTAMYPKTAMNCGVGKLASGRDLVFKDRRAGHGNEWDDALTLTALTSGSNMEHISEMPMWKKMNIFSFPRGGSWKNP